MTEAYLDLELRKEKGGTRQWQAFFTHKRTHKRTHAKALLCVHLDAACLGAQILFRQEPTREHAVRK